MRMHATAIVVVLGFGCGVPVDSEVPEASVRVQSITVDHDGAKSVLLELAPSHTLEFIESPEGDAYVFERRPLAAHSVLPASVVAADVYNELRRDNSELPPLFDSATSSALTGGGERLGLDVGLRTSALSKEAFLAGDGICRHTCTTSEFQENSAFPFESGEKCRTDIVGRNFRHSDGAPEGTGPAVDTLLVGEKFFVAVNARDAGGTFQVRRLQQEWTFEGSQVVDYRQSSLSTLSRVIERGQAFSGGFTVRQPTNAPNTYRRGTVYAEMVGDDAALYDFYGCAALSRRTPTARQGE